MSDQYTKNENKQGRSKVLFTVVPKKMEICQSPDFFFVWVAGFDVNVVKWYSER